MKRIMVVALLAAFVFAQGASAKSFTFGDTTFNAENEEQDINPHNAYSGWACIRYGVGETLFRYSDGMEIEPWLATGYQRVDDLTWKIFLRDGVKFTSGRAMDAQAVKECFEHLLANHVRASGDLAIESMTADGQTLTIRTSRPKPALLNYLSDPYGCVIDVCAGFDGGIVSGTGPYRAVSLVTDEKLELTKNDAYWNGRPAIDEITVVTISDGDTLTMALQSGGIDAAYGLPYASYPLFQGGYTFTSAATSRAFFLWLNFESPLTSDPSVRRAIAMGVDKAGFVDVLLGGNGYVATGAFPDGFAFGGKELTAPTYDPERAKGILESAGWVDSDGDGIREKDGRRLRIHWLTYPSRQELPLLAEYAQSTLRRIGIDLAINCTADVNSLRVDPTKWDVYASAMVTCPTGDPEYFFTSCALRSSAANNGKYSSDALEDLAREMSETFGEDERADLAIKMQQTVIDDVAYVFCSHLKMSMVARPGVRGLRAHPCDFYEITVDLDVD